MRACRSGGLLRVPALALALALGASRLAAAVTLLPSAVPTSVPQAVSAGAEKAEAPKAKPAPVGLLAAVCYHRFGVESPKDPYRISLERLAAQLRWLRAQGWVGVSLAQVDAALAGDARALPPKAILLSIDDGYKAGALAAPVFERYGYRAVYFVVPAVLGRGAFLSYQDLRGLEAKGFDIGSHTLTHADLAKVPHGMDPEGYARWVAKELGEPKRLLEAALGHPVTALAWPYGAYNPAVASAALRLGYRQLWSVSGGLNDESRLDAPRLRRLILIGHPSLAAFTRRMGELPLAPYAGGVEEGSLIYRSQLPLRVRVPSGCEAVLGGKAVALDAQHGFWLGRATRGGFHYLNIAEEDGKGRRLTPFLFQVAPDAWRPYFEALAGLGPPLQAPRAAVQTKPTSMGIPPVPRPSGAPKKPEL